MPEFNVYQRPEPLGCGVTAGRAVSRVPICGGVDLQPSGDTVTVGAVAVRIVEEQVRFVIDCVGYVEAQAELVRVGREGGEVFCEVSLVLGRGAGGQRSGVGPRESRRRASCLSEGGWFHVCLPCRGGYCAYLLGYRHRIFQAVVMPVLAHALGIAAT